MDQYKPPMHNYFSTYFIDRVSDRRRDEEWLAAQLEEKTTRFVPVWQLKNLFTTDEVPKPVYLVSNDIQNLLSEAESTVFLGVKGNNAHFAVGLPSKGDSPPTGLAEFGQFRELRGAAAFLNEQDGALLAYARAMTYWHCRHRFCGVCGSPTQSLEGGTLRVCTNSQCGYQHFPRTDPAIIALVTCGERCLLGHKSWWPDGMYSNVSGFVEPGESLEEAVMRELHEEAGVEVQDITYHSSQPWPFPSALMLGFMARASNETIRVDQDELEDARWFSREEMQRELKAGTLRLPMKFSVSYRLIEDWFDAGDLGQLRIITDERGE